MIMMEAAVFAQRAVVPTVVVVLAVAVYTDCRWRLIHNGLTFPAMALGLLWHLVSDGWPGLGWGVLGMATGFGLMMIPFVFGQMGGGDVKLMAALGSLLGAYAILNVFLYTTLAGGLLALMYAVGNREGLNTFKRVGQLASALVARKPAATPDGSAKPSITIPYGVAIATGTVIYLVFGKVV
jgi:prepilin peptidase CpaA